MIANQKKFITINIKIDNKQLINKFIKLNKRNMKIGLSNLNILKHLIKVISKVEGRQEKRERKKLNLKVRARDGTSV